MSSLSHSPYLETILYWAKKNIPNKLTFLITKIVEIHAFKSNSKSPPVAISRDDFNLPNISPVPNSIDDNSKIAVVVPCYAKDQIAVKQIKHLASALAKNRNTQIDNIFFIDDCSPFSYDLCDYPEISFTKLQKNLGPANARNIGLKKALSLGCDIIAFTDSDCIPAQDWISEIKKFFLQNKHINILSGKVISFGKTWFDIYHNINGTLNGRKFKKSGFLLYGTTANFAITSDVGNSLQFDTSFLTAAGEDIDFCFQALKTGFMIGYAQDAVVQHDYSYSGKLFIDLKKFRSQFIRYAKGENTLLKKNPDYYIYFDETEEISSLQ